MGRLTWTSKKFLEDKVQELLCAVKNLGIQPVAQSEINEYVSLTNGMKNCFLKVGILEECNGEGKASMLRINFGNCNVDKVREAYSIKAVRKANTIHKTSKSVSMTVAPKVDTNKEMFPSLEDCKKYLEHLGRYTIIQIPDGFELDTITMKKK